MKRIPLTLSLRFVGILVFFCGCFHNPADSGGIGNQYEHFAVVWEYYEANYPEFTLKGVNWEDLFYKYSPLAEQAETTEELVMDVLVPMLGELHDGHIQFRTPEGTVIYSYMPDINYNYDITVLLENYLYPAEFNDWENGVGYCNPSLLPYLSINSWNSDLVMERVAEFFQQASDCPAVIIDIRMNSGGSDYLCDDVAGIFADTGVLAWRKRIRIGPDYDDVFHIPHYTIPNTSIDYDGTAYLLIGDYSASASEEFVLYMDVLDSVVLLGDTTMGAVCAPSTISLADGWHVNLINWSMRGPDFEPVEGCGIPPDIYVEATAEDFAMGIDPVLEYAIEMLSTHQ